MFIDDLVEKIKYLNNPSVLGLDPMIDYVPEFIKYDFFKTFGYTLKGASESILEFNKTLIDSIYDIVPAVKPQLAYYEQYGIEGVRAFEETVSYAKLKGLLVIADGKRNDIGSTSEAYANAFLGETFVTQNKSFTAFKSDALTVNPYLGVDGIKPFTDICKRTGNGIFVLVKTSNPSSVEIQDLVVSDGRTIYENVADLVKEWGSELMGKCGYSSVGAVVGATFPENAVKLRERMPNTYFLVPGYGAQGGSAKDLAVYFNKDGLGAIINSSRSFMCAYKSELWRNKYNEEHFGDASRAEAIRMRDEINSAIGGT